MSEEIYNAEERSSPEIMCSEEVNSQAVIDFHLDRITTLIREHVNSDHRRRYVVSTGNGQTEERFRNIDFGGLTATHTSDNLGTDIVGVRCNACRHSWNMTGEDFGGIEDEDMVTVLSKLTEFVDGINNAAEAERERNSNVRERTANLSRDRNADVTDGAARVRRTYTVEPRGVTNVNNVSIPIDISTSDGGDNSEHMQALLNQQTSQPTRREIAVRNEANEANKVKEASARKKEEVDPNPDRDPDPISYVDL